MRVFRHRDFRLLWSGAFLSFIGSWVQTVAQQYLVYQMTHDPTKLAWVGFFSAIPVSFLGPIAGAVTDMYHKRMLLVACQSLMACGALFLALATSMGFVQYWHILVTALLVGTVSAVEMPTRQSVVSRVVPQDELATAIPLNALTFNLARLVGPAIGGVLLTEVGVSTCYLVNGLSYIALIAGALAIRADLRAEKREPQPIMDLVTEGMRYTFREVRLRTLFLLEATVSVFGLLHLTQMPAIAQQVLGISSDQLESELYKETLANLFLASGIGAVLALAIITYVAQRKIKATLLRLAMTTQGIGLIVLATARSPWTAYLALALLGLSAVTHFNTTNTLFQLLSPESLRGRVLAMHVWALSGLNPFGTILLGYLAGAVSVSFAIGVGAAGVLLGAIVAWAYRPGLAGFP